VSQLGKALLSAIPHTAARSFSPEVVVAEINDHSIGGFVLGGAIGLGLYIKKTQYVSNKINDYKTSRAMANAARTNQNQPHQESAIRDIELGDVEVNLNISVT
jgi:hypothetical protein